jgi:hypothetical protein
MRYHLLIPTLLVAVSAAANAQRPSDDDPSPRLNLTPVSLSGPRVGLTAIAGSLADTLKARYGAAPVVSQFGWQFETRMFEVEGGYSAMTELVGLVGGLEQGLFLPSVSWLVALRSRTGAEFGLGPNVSPAGPALALAGGVTLKSSVGINFPVNLAVVSGKGGQRVSMLVGFTLER